MALIDFLSQQLWEQFSCKYRRYPRVTDQISWTETLRLCVLWVSWGYLSSRLRWVCVLVPLSAFFFIFFISPAFTSFSYFNQVDRQTRGACVNTVRSGFWFSSRLKDIRLTSLWGFLFLFGKLILTWKAPGEATYFGVFFVSHPCIQITLTLSSHFCRGVVVFFFVWLNSKEK